MQDGWNPLMRASTEGNLKLVKIIADRGGQLNDVLKEVLNESDISKYCCMH